LKIWQDGAAVGIFTKEDIVQKLRALNFGDGSN
jgi:predicted transcriptional regulator